MATDALVPISETRRMLAATQSIELVKECVDKAEALRVYFKKVGTEHRKQNHAAEQKLWAMRRAGELLAQMPNAKTGPKQLSNGVLPNSQTLADIGITRMQSSRWQAIAAIEEQKFLAYIEETRAAEKEITAVGAAKLAKKSTNRRDAIDPVSYGICTSLHDLIAQGLKFPTIYADPPWQYANKATRSNVESEYASTMTVDEICAEPVADLVEDDAHLHLWTTNAFLFDAKRVIEAWGFEYKSCFVWCKPQMGIGNYWRVSHEFLLLGVRGKLEFADHSIQSWDAIDRTKTHSRKPPKVRKLVERVSPGPYLELYGRERLDAPWTVYGNEIDERSLDDANGSG